MSETALAETRAWVERAIIGLQLCPFARAPQVKGRVRYALSTAADAEALLGDLAGELHRLVATPADVTETTLLVHPHVLTDFDDYNDFLDLADALLVSLDLDGVVQVASFHPDYRFAGSAPGDIANATNRAPFPTLHLLREASIEHALASFAAGPESIYEANIATMERLGADGWETLRQACRDDAGRD